MVGREAEEHFERGIQFFRGGFFPSALREFLQAEKVDPEYPNIAYLVAATRKKAEEVSGKLLSSFEETFDESMHRLADFLHMEGRTDLGPEIARLLKDGQPDEAMRKISAAAIIVPDSRPLLLMMASVQRRIGKLKEAEETLRRAKVLYSGDQEILNNLGNVFLAQNQFRSAREHFLEALKHAPDSIVVKNNLGSLDMQTYRLDSACRIFEELARANPGWLPARRNLENLRRRMNELEEEIGRLRREYHDHPTYYDVGINLGKALLFRGYFIEAQKTLDDIIARKPELTAAYFYLGNLHEIEDRLEKAIACYREMVVKKGKTSLPEFAAFFSLMKEGYVEEALAELKKIAILDLNLSAGHINIGIRYFEEAHWKKALAHFDAAISLNDSYADAFFWKGLAHVQLGRKSEARKDFEQALAINPAYPDALYQLGLLLRKSSPKKAADYLHQALKAGLRPQYELLAKDWLQHLPEGKGLAE
jgi:tetratricopeptide (TPR) repeat protein